MATAHHPTRLVCACTRSPCAAPRRAARYACMLCASVRIRPRMRARVRVRACGACVRVGARAHERGGEAVEREVEAPQRPRLPPPGPVGHPPASRRVCELLRIQSVSSFEYICELLRIENTGPVGHPTARSRARAAGVGPRGPAAERSDPATPRDPHRPPTCSFHTALSNTDIPVDSNRKLRIENFDPRAQAPNLLYPYRRPLASCPTRQPDYPLTHTKKNQKNKHTPRTRARTHTHIRIDK